MIEDMNARKLCAGTQRGHIHSCKRLAVFLNRSPDTATEDIRRFQLHLAVNQHRTGTLRYFTQSN
jgi:integrase/recombinase XerD